MESETEGQAHEAVAFVTASAQMRSAREAAGLPLAEVAARTRVPLRHLEALERGDFAALPGITYCAGFTRAYARAVGLDEKALVSKVRSEIDAAGDFPPTDAYQIDEPADPARVPPRTLAWVVAIVGVLMVSGYGIWRMQLNTPPGEDVAIVDRPVAAPTGVAQVAIKPPVLTGPVVLTAVEDVWLRIYDADGKSLLQKTMVKGESFTVPADANNPMILTGRADALAVTVGGRPIPPLGTAERTISDVPISAEALLARGTAQGTAPTPVTTPPAAAVPAPPQAGTAPAQPARAPAASAPAARAPAPQSRPAAPARPSNAAPAARTQVAPRPAQAVQPRPSAAPARPDSRPAPAAPAPAAPEPSAASNAAGQ